MFGITSHIDVLSEEKFTFENAVDAFTKAFAIGQVWELS